MGSLLCTSDGSVWWRRWLSNPTLSITRSIEAWGALFSFWIRTLKQGIFLASWQRPMASGGNCSSKGRFFTVANTIVNIPSMKAARLNRKMRGSNLQQNKTKTGNSRISLKLPQRFIRTQKPLPKETRWSKTMLLWDSQPCRRVVLRKRRETEASVRVIVR